MEVIRISPNNVIRSKEPLSISLGDFDGFHLGHQSLALASFADSTYLNAILFLSSSYKRIRGEDETLSNLTQKIAWANQNRYERAYVLDVDEAFFLSPKEEFEKLLKDLGVKEVFAGEDYRYGYQAKGNLFSLSKADFKVHKVSLKRIDGEKVSSHIIKQLVKEGDFVRATSLLGRPYEVYGKVIRGKQNGRKMGIPTANLSFLDPYVIPAFGAYYGTAIVRGRSYTCMISVGTNPTFMGTERSVEAHLLNFDMDIYGESIYLSFWEKIRENKPFESIEGLQKQLHQDKESTVEYFKKIF
ncbi:MAG: riboflavin biosynthesis protein RibF [Bacilli bacterium]|nr:riboflavin biosynthesis protein RibF [Bacilli bacterium]